MSILLTVLEYGTIYALMATGVYITYKILDFPDLTVDGSFPLGAALTATMLAAGASPLLALPVAFAAGTVAGALTGIIHVKFKVRDLIASIIMMTALYTVNLRVAGKANVPFFGFDTIFTNPFIDSVMPEALAPYAPLVVILAISLAGKFAIDWYLKTKSGFLLRAVGDNAVLVTTLAKDKGSIKIIGLALANGLVALAGSVMAQRQNFFDISMGTGTVLIGLASVIIGTSLFRNLSWIKATTSVIVGSIIYRGCVALAIMYGLTATDMKLVTAVLLFVILVAGAERAKKGRSTKAAASKVVE